MKDKLFIFLTIILLILFAVRIASNIPREDIKETPEKEIAKIMHEDDALTRNILTRLENAGLEPREAKYYK